jgi:hypothetical protein
LAESIVVRPTPRTVALRIAHLPAGFIVADWFGAVQGTITDVTVTVRPPNVSPLDDIYKCVDLHMGSGVAATSNTADPAIVLRLAMLVTVG